MRFPMYAGLAVFVVAGAAACGGGTTLPRCPPLALPIPAFYMVYPSPGATGVPDSLSDIVFAGSPVGSVTLAGGTQTIALTLEPAPTPTPTPQGGLPQSIAALSMRLSGRTTYTVLETYNVGGSNCSAPTGIFSVGSFTTQ
jgi:hypothetical protein